MRGEPHRPRLEFERSQLRNTTFHQENTNGKQPDF